MVLHFGAMPVAQPADGPQDWCIHTYSIGRWKMGQRAEFRTAERYRPRTRTGSTVLSIFPTDLGWFGLLGRGESVLRLCFGHVGPAEVRQALAGCVDAAGASECDWTPDLRRRLEGYAAGEIDSFRDVRVAMEGRTQFQKTVIGALRSVGYGETVSYRELAELAGSPRSARAVGRVMAANRVPIIVACHRVLASGGGLGGFSAPQGTAMKRRLLQMEGAEAIR
ncbi:MAG: methylated-DNA--[protein]-cysteine S-methyltransferase [Planctomycetota bacterium]|nr:MAG: methylated-DNA--[protein]-cysteine S-methyltransferase [Planctomycetota bacterium]REK26552.1 MAG: methylated-DNA--[protein]-cysteine S-methyltransferase [Planctomycetota bacterium]REK34039.1 MAG: methylated-DNA--[protein]-cysteine S-methyltransferase [Planctomycetota bacterium]